MPPPSPLLVAPAPVRAAVPSTVRRLASFGLACLLAGSLLAGGAAAETPEQPTVAPPETVVKTKPQVFYRKSLIRPGPRQRSSLLPQTRYTVRKQIESIEPISWLKRYGKVQVRELEH